MKFLDTKEAAVLLRLTPNSLARMRCMGDGPPYVKPSPGRVLYDERVVLEWLAARQYSSTAQERRH